MLLIERMSSERAAWQLLAFILASTLEVCQNLPILDCLLAVPIVGGADRQETSQMLDQRRRRHVPTNVHPEPRKLSGVSKAMWIKARAGHQEVPFLIQRGLGIIVADSSTTVSTSLRQTRSLE